MITPNPVVALHIRPHAERIQLTPARWDDQVRRLEAFLDDMAALHVEQLENVATCAWTTNSKLSNVSVRVLVQEFIRPWCTGWCRTASWCKWQRELSLWAPTGRCKECGH